MIKASERADTTYITNLLNVAVLKFLTPGPMSLRSLNITLDQGSRVKLKAKVPYRFTVAFS